jgi:rfaE bifunctional protein nucleotidyltransferase chain/domain
VNAAERPESGSLSLAEAQKWRESLRDAGKKLVVTNGCFDIMHRGHAAYLREARLAGDALLVLINSDASVRELKGAKRPVVSENDRAYMLCALSSVDRVVIFDGMRCDRELAAIAPDVYVKGGDYTLDKLDPDERAALEKSGTKIVFKPFIPGFSTTTLIRRILDAEKN